MRFTFQIMSIVALIALGGCPKPETAIEKKPEEPVVVEAPRTALGIIRQAHGSLEADCGKHLDAIDLEGLKAIELHDSERDEADKLLADLGLFAQQCGSFTAPLQDAADTCDPDCHWCPIKWYWCIENAGACAGGDNESCCKLGACGSKHHCEDVCKSSCGCDVPPLPADGGGGGEE